jgi:hypothetical protein
MSGHRSAVGEEYGPELACLAVFADDRDQHACVFRIWVAQAEYAMRPWGIVSSEDGRKELLAPDFFDCVADIARIIAVRIGAVFQAISSRVCPTCF